MSDPENFMETLSRPGSLCLGSNEEEAAKLKELIPSLKRTEVDGVVCWHEDSQPSAANTRIRVYPTGHRVFYGAGGRRFLFTDPEGHPLHEAEWQRDESGGAGRLIHARMQLDCLQWVGIRPRAKTFTTELDLKSNANWRDMSLDDMRQQAADAWNVPVSEVGYFYKDENFTDLGNGKYRIQITKDGLYALRDGGFDQTLFVSFMFSLNWARLDLIPVVELFQSTLPGSGGAVFEFLWGLYDDQSRESPLAPLRYRGLPAYPSPEAFNIFSAFFIPAGPAGEDLKEVFMDTARCHEITWTPVKNPPWRYFSREDRACLTVQDRFLYKVTIGDDPVGIPFVNCARGARPFCQRRLGVTKDSIRLLDGETVTRSIPLRGLWNVEPSGDSPAQPPSPFDWRHFFRDGAPNVDPVKILYTVPFYPESESEIEEASLQPMVLDQIFYYMEMSPHMPEKLEKIRRVLIHTFDTVISGCIDCTREREYTVLFSDAEFAQKNAQLLWQYAASRGQLDNLKQVRFLPEAENVEAVYQKQYDMVFKWIPFFYFTDQEICAKILQASAQALPLGGILFLVGPAPIAGLFGHFGLTPLHDDPVAEMPFFQQHRKMCPENIVHPGVTVFLLEKK